MKITMNEKAKRHLFLRDYTRPNKHPLGCVAMHVDREKGKISYAVSVCSPKDRWSSNIAKDKAFGRLDCQPSIIETSIPKSWNDITKLIMQDIVNSNKTQSKDHSRSVLAFEAANLWLNKAQ